LMEGHASTAAHDSRFQSGPQETNSAVHGAGCVVLSLDIAARMHAPAASTANTKNAAGRLRGPGDAVALAWRDQRGAHLARITVRDQWADAQLIACTTAKLDLADPLLQRSDNGRPRLSAKTIKPRDRLTAGIGRWPMRAQFGRPKASLENYSYSETLKNWGSSWSYDDLNAFVWGPKITAPGVRMLFEGIENEEIG
jgi:hypothetical protein